MVTRSVGSRIKGSVGVATRGDAEQRSMRRTPMGNIVVFIIGSFLT
jgi:hypothetical protein